MQSMRIIIFLVLFLLILINPSSVTAATERRIALVIGNGAYSSGPLKNPVNDATDIAAALKKIGFSVTLKKNAQIQEMEEAIEEFGNRLKRGGVGLFYYAGHGVQVNGVNYLIPIGAKINKESDVRFKAFDAGRVLAEMENANNGLNIVLLDACRDNPFGKSFRSASRGLAIVSSAPAGTFISYSTGAGQVARDGEDRNSPYTKALLQYMQEPGLTIEDVFKGVRQKLRKETGQVPWELSSLEGKFYFRPGSAVESAPMTSTPIAERELLRQKAALEEERSKLEEEKKKLAMSTPPVPAVTEIRRDGQFIAYSDGTVLDTATNLMWAAKDNGYLIRWGDAKHYCEGYRGGGYTDWRMPTHDELAGLFDYNKNQKNESQPDWPVHLNDLVDLTHTCIWASNKRGLNDVAYFNFSYGGKLWFPEHLKNDAHAIPVRTVGKQSTVKETGRDGRFIAYDNGTVFDTRTKLMWASEDKYGVNWLDAKSYCETYRGGGYTNWRMPTKNELVDLYDKTKLSRNASGRDVYLTGLIRLTRSTWIWASETRGSHAAYLSFGALVPTPEPEWNPQNDSSLSALPVRFVK